VYWHFRDKADLCAAMCERALLPLEMSLRDAGTAEHEDPLQVLRELALAALTRLATDPRSQAVFEVMLHESAESVEMAAIAERKQRERRQCLVHVERVVQQAVDCGQLPEDTDASLAARAMHAYIGGIMQDWVLDPAAYDLEACAAELVDAIVAGLRVAPPRVRRSPASGARAPQAEGDAVEKG
jgi:TetR/AcrR family acrAB operon transcriptional repressor